MARVLTVARRELAAYFATPIAYVVLIVFAVLSGVFAFYLGNLYERGIADLAPYFIYLPWLLMVFVPAVAMRLWSEERRSGTIELLMTLPVSAGEAVVGKWLAGVAFIAVALAATMPLWLTVNYLGEPDNGVIAVSYVAALAVGAVFLAIGACLSALTRNQVVAFVLAVAASFVFLTAGTPLVLDAVRTVVPEPAAAAVASLSVLTHYETATRGIVDAAGAVWAASMVAFWLFANTVAVDATKAR